MTRAIADTSVFVAQETGRELDALPEEIGVSVITAAELELGVLRATDAGRRALRLDTLSRDRSTSLIPIDPETASCFARLADATRSEGRKLRRLDTWIAATALRHGVAVLTQDKDFTKLDPVEVILL
ncbi:MAG: PIN domain-containing protein [Solirubrobacterales bacterium]|nr:PIN domain-containing protein [Solirubrobacterales bacterium]HMT06313.1 PIN domain-containing protein [Solirubrobacterales bacterium]